MFLKPQCGNRYLKGGILLLLIFCLILMFLWSRNRSRSSVQPRSPSQFNDTSFQKQPVSRGDNSSPFLVLLVTSSPDQFETRSAIRQTWGSERRVGEARSVTYFLLGHGRERQELIQREVAVHRDIIQGDFQDTYHNLTLKVLLGLEWLCRSCPSASFVMKTDSDMFVNTEYLMELLSRHTRSNVYTGLIVKGARPFRDTSSKWYVSKEEYPGEVYPPYCSGIGYVLSTELACRVWNISGRAPLLKLEDVYVGLRVAELKVEPVEIHTRPVFFGYRVAFSTCSYRQLVTSHGVRSSELQKYWRELQDSAAEKCP